MREFVEKGSRSYGREKCTRGCFVKVQKDEGIFGKKGEEKIKLRKDEGIFGKKREEKIKLRKDEGIFWKRKILYTRIVSIKFVLGNKHRL